MTVFPQIRIELKNMMQQLPIGQSDFKKLREKGAYYVDKSLFIRDILQRPAEVLLLPRPRRFGKTLNLSMLRYFFEKREESAAQLFKGLAIEQDAEAMRHQGQYPVIFLTFKDCKESAAEQCIYRIRTLLKDLYLEYKPHLGILRIANESIFSGLNNPEVFSLLYPEFQEYFGFTEAEIEQLVEDFAIREADDLEDWYNGYIFGNQVIYNPWSVLNFIARGDRIPRPYWINTSSNSLLRDLVTRSEPEFQERMETLLAGGTVTTPLNENIVLRDLTQDEKNVWSLLVFSGYLKPVSREFIEDEPVYKLAIPNREVRSFFRNTIQLWVRRTIGGRCLDDLLKSLTRADWKTFGKLLQDMVPAVLSYHDTAGDEPERVYHAFVLGLLTNLSGRYQTRSNRESGYGRYDMLMIPHDRDAPGFIFEFKKTDPVDDKDADEAMQSALQQIRERQYAAELRDLAVKTVWGVGVVVDGKQVWTKSVRL